MRIVDGGIVLHEDPVRTADASVVVKKEVCQYSLIRKGIHIRVYERDIRLAVPPYRSPHHDPTATSVSLRVEQLWLTGIMAIVCPTIRALKVEPLFVQEDAVLQLLGPL